MTDPIPIEIADGEELGRAVFDSSKAQRARRDGTIPPKVFRERDGVPDLSVDRLSFGSLPAIATIQDRNRGRACLGWAWVSAADARGSGRQAVSDRLPDNAYHALIVLPASSGVELEEAQLHHSVELALAAKWQERPTV